MFRKKRSVNQLALRKQILIAESEINRAKLVQEGEILMNGFRAATTKAKSVRSLASIAALLVAGTVALRSKKITALNGKFSWLQTALKGAKFIAPIWLALRRRSRKENPEPEESQSRFD